MTDQSIIDRVVATAQREAKMQLRLERAERLCIKVAADRDRVSELAKNLESISKHWISKYHETCDKYEALLDNRVYKNVDRVTIGGIDLTVQR